MVRCSSLHMRAAGFPCLLIYKLDPVGPTDCCVRKRETTGAQLAVGDRGLQVPAGLPIPNMGGRARSITPRDDYESVVRKVKLSRQTVSVVTNMSISDPGTAVAFRKQ